MQLIAIYGYSYMNYSLWSRKNLITVSIINIMGRAMIQWPANCRSRESTDE